MVHAVQPVVLEPPVAEGLGPAAGLPARQLQLDISLGTLNLLEHFS